jgi:L-asparaginase II
MGGSHSGERGHIDTVRGLLVRYGLTEDLFQCGPHYAYYQQATWEFGRDNTPITAIHNNCSGKHTAMLLACQAQGWPFETYLDADHPLQQANTARLARLIGEDPGELVYGVDGCSVPTWWLPIRKTALAFARFGSQDWAETGTEKSAVLHIFDSFHRAAWHTAGTDRFGTPFNAESDGNWLGKIGGEGIYCVSFRDKGIGLVVKVQDGNSRAIPPALLHSMHQWDLIDDNGLSRLSDWVEVERKNHAGRSIGHIRVVS